MKKLVLLTILLFLIAVYIFVDIPKSIGYYARKEGDTGSILSYNNRNYVHITSEVDEQLGEKLGIAVDESMYGEKWIYFDIFNWFSVKDEIFALKKYEEEDYLVTISHPVMETITSLYVNTEQKSIPIKFIPSAVLKKESKLVAQNTDYFLVGYVKDENLIGKKLTEVIIKNRSLDVLLVNDSVGDEWVALKDGDRYRIYSKGKELLTSISINLYLELEI